MEAFGQGAGYELSGYEPTISAYFIVSSTRIVKMHSHFTFFVLTWKTVELSSHEVEPLVGN